MDRQVSLTQNKGRLMRQGSSATSGSNYQSQVGMAIKAALASPKYVATSKLPATKFSAKAPRAEKHTPVYPIQQKSSEQACQTEMTGDTLEITSASLKDTLARLKQAEERNHRLED